MRARVAGSRHQSGRSARLLDKALSWTRRVFNGDHAIPLLVAGITTLVALTSAAVSWTEKNDFGNRYEGIIEQPVAASLEVVSFIGQFEPFGPGDSKKLSVHFYAPGGQFAPIVNARELVLRKFYWMQSKPKKWTANAWNAFQPWDTTSVLKPKGIGSDNLGVVVWLDRIDGPTVSPAYVIHTERLRPVAEYVVRFRPDGTLKELKYAVLEGEGKTQRILQEGSLAGTWTSNVTLRLVIPTNGLPAGWLTLKTTSRFMNEPTKPPEQVRFFHAGGVPRQ